VESVAKVCLSMRCQSPQYSNFGPTQQPVQQEKRRYKVLVEKDLRRDFRIKPRPPAAVSPRSNSAPQTTIAGNPARFFPRPLAAAL
jgi:hypothetical protein